MGFVKVPHDLTKWEWYGDSSTLSVYLRMLLSAEWCDTKCGNVNIRRGQVMTTLRKISVENGLSMRQTRTILERLKSSNKVTIKTTPNYSIITLLDYDCARESDKRMTNERQTADTPTLLNKKEKNKRDQENARAREDKTAESEALNKSFDLFWEKYPRKTAKQQALSAWRKLKPDEKLVERIIAAIDKHKRSTQWTQDNGQFVPYPATWLNGRRWEDEITEVKDNVTRSGTKADEVDWYAGF